MAYLHLLVPLKNLFEIAYGEEHCNQWFTLTFSFQLLLIIYLIRKHQSPEVFSVNYM